MRTLPLIFVFVLLAGCARPGWLRVPDVSMPDLSFGREDAVEVQEVARADVCNSAGGESAVSVLQNLGALNAWAADRRIELLNTSGKPLPDAPFAVVEFGQRPNGGYGLAVSRQAGMRGGELLLKATYFEPQQGRWASSAPSSPCVVVALPPREYSVVKLIDQTGKVRAGTADRSP